MKLVAPLFDGPIDVVGDVHGEVEALERLLANLGYDARGGHRDGRRLVFVGDLTDRGPDSPAVLERVMALCAAGRAQCVAGNHELNLLRDVRKDGNDWWVCPEVESKHPFVPVTPAAKPRFTRFLHGLPLALERDDLRVVHACWHAESVAALRRREGSDASVLALYDEYARRFESRWKGTDRAATRERERERESVDLKDRDAPPPFLPALAQYDAEHQVTNPVSVLTSGLEAPVRDRRPFWAGGKWRMVERVRWWEDYDHPVPVIVGHYWRRFAESRGAADRGPDLFAGVAPHHWMGRQGNVYCVDFSVGERPYLRRRGQPEHAAALAALRVPEWRVVHDHGDAWDIGPPGGPGDRASSAPGPAHRAGHPRRRRHPATR